VATVDQQTASGNATGTAKTRYVHPDQLGSTNVVTDENDNLVQTLDYYPYGATRISSATSTNERRKYLGQFADDSSLNYLNARYYDSNRGQFVSEDPSFLSADKALLADPQNLNAYSYSGDNPITFIDSKGDYPISPETGYPFERNQMGDLFQEPIGGSYVGNSAIAQNLGIINQYGSDAPIIKSIIYEEQSHELFKNFLGMSDRFGKTVGLGNVTVNDSSNGNTPYTRNQLLDPRTNIKDIDNRIKLITAALSDKGIGSGSQNFVSYVGSAYNNYNNLGSVSNYGLRVQSYYNDLMNGKTALTPESSFGTSSGGPGTQYLAGKLGIGNTQGAFIGTYNFGPGIGTFNFGTGQWAK
jgi:RHS repeat-associated protein